MLILELNSDEPVEFIDTVSGLKTVVKVFFRANGRLALAVDAPSEVKINRSRSENETGNKS